MTGRHVLRVKKMDFDELTLVATPTSPEDLWSLYVFVEEGDLVRGRTHRVVKLGPEGAKAKEKLPLTATITVLDKSLDLASSKLNLSGKVVAAPEDVEGMRGRFHTISIQPGTEVTVMKSGRNPILWKMLRERIRDVETPVVVLAIESGSASLAIVSSLGALNVREIRSPMAGKDRPEERRLDELRFFAQVAAELGELLGESGGKVAIVGPGFTKEDFVSYLEREHPSIRKDVVKVASATSGTPAGIHESLRSGALESLAKHLRSAREISLVEDLLRAISVNPQMVALGPSEVLKALSAGAVETLLILDTFAPRFREGGLEGLLEEVRRFGGDFRVICSKHEGGLKLKSLGGIAALLRYSIE